MKLLIISEDAGTKTACGRGTGNYYITSDGLSLNTRALELSNPSIGSNIKSAIMDLYTCFSTNYPLPMEIKTLAI